MHWVRIILPMIIAAFGWYVGHIIGTFGEDVAKLEEKVQAQEVACMTRAAQTSVQLAELRRDVDDLTEADKLQHADVISKEEYLRNLSELRRRIGELERSRYQQGQE